MAEYLSFVVLEEFLNSGQNDIIDNGTLSRLWSVFNLKMCEAFEFEFEAMVTLNPIILNTSNLIKYYNPVPYQKGAAFFRNLCMLVGKKVFNSILKKVCNFYSHHNISTSILFNLVKVMIRNMDEDDVCMLEESDLEKYWFDNLLLPFYSCILVSGFSYKAQSNTLDVSFEEIANQLPFDQSFKEDYFEEVIGEGHQHSTPEDLKKAMACHSAEELIGHQVSPVHCINRQTISRRTNFFKVTILDSDCKVIFESWCKLWTPETKMFTVPDVQVEPHAIILNGHGESYAKVFLDDKTLAFLFSESNILKIDDPDMRVSLYLTMALSPQLPHWEDKVRACLEKEPKLIQKIVSPKFLSKTAK